MANTWALGARSVAYASAMSTESDEPRLEQLERAIAVLRVFGGSVRVSR